MFSQNLKDITTIKRIKSHLEQIKKNRIQMAIYESEYEFKKEVIDKIILDELISNVLKNIETITSEINELKSTLTFIRSNFLDSSFIHKFASQFIDPINELSSYGENLIALLKQYTQLQYGLNYSENFKLYSYFSNVCGNIDSFCQCLASLKVDDPSATDLKIDEDHFIKLKSINKKTQESMTTLHEFISTCDQKIKNYDKKIKEMMSLKENDCSALFDLVKKSKEIASEKNDLKLWPAQLSVLLNAPDELEANENENPALWKLKLIMLGEDAFIKNQLRSIIIKTLLWIYHHPEKDIPELFTPDNIDSYYYQHEKIDVIGLRIPDSTEQKISCNDGTHLIGDKKYPTQRFDIMHRWDTSIRYSFENALALITNLPKEVDHLHYENLVLYLEEFLLLLQATPPHVTKLTFNRIKPLIVQDVYKPMDAVFLSNAIKCIPPHVRYLEIKGILDIPDLWPQVIKCISPLMQFNLCDNYFGALPHQLALSFFNAIPATGVVNFRFFDPDHKIFFTDIIHKVQSHVAEKFISGNLEFLFDYFEKEQKLCELEETLDKRNAKMDLFMLMTMGCHKSNSNPNCVEFMDEFKDEYLAQYQKLKSKCEVATAALNAEKNSRENTEDKADAAFFKFPQQVMVLDLSNNQNFFRNFTKRNINFLKSMFEIIPDHVKKLDLSKNDLHTNNLKTIIQLMKESILHPITIIDLSKNSFLHHQYESTFTSFIEALKLIPDCNTSINLSQIGLSSLQEKDLISVFSDINLELFKKLTFEKIVHQTLEKIALDAFNATFNALNESDELNPNLLQTLQVGIKTAPHIILNAFKALLHDETHCQLSNLNSLFTILIDSANVSTSECKKELCFLIGERIYRDVLMNNGQEEQDKLRLALYYLELAQDFGLSETEVLKLQAYHRLVNANEHVINSYREIYADQDKLVILIRELTLALGPDNGALATPYEKARRKFLNDLIKERNAYWKRFIPCEIPKRRTRDDEDEQSPRKYHRPK